MSQCAVNGDEKNTPFLSFRVGRALTLSLALFGLVFGLVVPAPAPALAANPTAGFQAGNIISDGNFYDGNAMSAAEVQSFLNSKLARCTIGDKGREAGRPIYNSTVASKCLRNLTLNTSNLESNAYCRGYPGKSNESAASVIAKVGKACNISQKVLLVMLQKEQSLVTDSWPTVRQFAFATGYNCPDTAPCSAGTKGFFQQVYSAAWQLNRYKALPNNYNYKPYRNNYIQWHPRAACGGSTVYIKNSATAALYIYTPYRPNQAALNAGWQTGNGCSSYGNRNFYNYYKAWFGAPVGYEVHDKLINEYDNLGGTRSNLGRPTANASVYNSSSVGQGFDHGSIYWSSETGAHAVYVGGIREYYWSSGSWTGPLGFPSGKQNVYQSGGKGQGFQFGSIYYHPGIGGVIVQDPVREKYWMLGSVSGLLRYPTGNASLYGDGGIGQGFQGGSIYWNEGIGAVYIQDPIRVKFWNLNSISGLLGYPTGDPSNYEDGGIGQGFENGSIYWNKNVGAVYIQNPIREKYWASGSITGELGYPQSDPSHYADGGLGQGFQSGSVYWHQATGAAIVNGEIREEFWRQGSISGELGYPMSDAVMSSDGLLRQHFQGGTIQIDADGMIEVQLPSRESGESPDITEPSSMAPSTPIESPEPEDSEETSGEIPGGTSDAVSTF